MIDRDQNRPELPDALARAVFSDFRPVRPVLRSETRMVIVSALAAAAAALLVAQLGMRHDVSLLPKLAFVSMLMVRVAAGLSLILLALREAIPSAGVSDRRRTLFAVIGLSMLIALPEMFSLLIGARQNGIIAGPWFCFPLVVAVSVPSFLGMLVLLSRAWPVRPVQTGFLAGLGSGILAEAAQFVVCANADPVHGGAVHGGAAISVALLGALAGLMLERNRRA